MKTAIDTIREALESAHHHFQNILDYGVAQGSDRDKVRAEQDILRAALTSLKSLDGRLTVDEAMEVMDTWINATNRLQNGEVVEDLASFKTRALADLKNRLTKSANP